MHNLGFVDNDLGFTKVGAGRVAGGGGDDA